VDNTAQVLTDNPDPTLCDPAQFPPLFAEGSSTQVAVVAAGGIDLLRNTTMTRLAFAGPAFDAPQTPNTTTCGETSLDRAADLSIYTSVTLPGSFDFVGDGAFVGAGNPGVIIFYEFTEYCSVEEGGARPHVTVRRAGADITVNGF
jgi:hypothetical protein